MAQTKRKRRTKHRGNAAGVIEARGRTGRRPSPEEQRKAAAGAGGRRQLKPPTWRGALMKGAVGGILLFVLTQVGVLANDTPVASSIFLALVAVLLYTPLAYATDTWTYNRWKRRQAGGTR